MTPDDKAPHVGKEAEYCRLGKTGSRSKGTLTAHPGVSTFDPAQSAMQGNPDTVLSGHSSHMLAKSDPHERVSWGALAVRTMLRLLAHSTLMLRSRNFDI